jgi:hypothetical protein
VPANVLAAHAHTHTLHLASCHFYGTTTCSDDGLLQGAQTAATAAELAGALADILSACGALLILSTTFAVKDKHADSIQPSLVSISRRAKGASQDLEVARWNALSKYIDVHGQHLTAEELSLFLLDPPSPDLTSDQMFEVCHLIEMDRTQRSLVLCVSLSLVSVLHEASPGFIL